MPFRLGAFRGGVRLRAGTSPPVLERIPGHRALAAALPQHDDPAAYLRLLGPATPRQVAGYLDAPVKEVQARWPSDAVPVNVEGEQRWVLADDLDRLTGADAQGPRGCWVPTICSSRPVTATCWSTTAARAKALWPVLGRPAPSCSAARSPGCGGPGRPAARCTWPSSPGAGSPRPAGGGLRAGRAPRGVPRGAARRRHVCRLTAPIGAGPRRWRRRRPQSRPAYRRPGPRSTGSDTVRPATQPTAAAGRGVRPPNARSALASHVGYACPACPVHRTAAWSTSSWTIRRCASSGTRSAPARRTRRG